jgi:hypothetical protein
MSGYGQSVLGSVDAYFTLYNLSPIYVAIDEPSSKLLSQLLFKS